MTTNSSTTGIDWDTLVQELIDEYSGSTAIPGQNSVTNKIATRTDEKSTVQALVDEATDTPEPAVVNATFLHSSLILSLIKVLL
jgi:hypothetical protein